MALLIYRLLFPFAFLLALPAYAFRAIRRERGRAGQAKPPGYRLGIGQRFGQYDAALRERLVGSPPIWICSISVGETLVALKLARAIRVRSPETRVVLSVTTSTAYELLLRETDGSPWIVPLYNPVDFAFATRSAISTVKPRAMVLIEGGIWPNLLRAARARGVRVVLAGARLSQRSEQRWRRFRSVAHAVWDLFDVVCVPDPVDVARFAGIGVAPERIRDTGNVKFDNSAATDESREPEFRALANSLGFSGSVLVGGSTWEPEEKELAAAFTDLRRTFPELRLILAPRHVERIDGIMRELSEMNLRVARRSALPADGPIDVLLIDTTGELRDWYRLATVVFVGKSLPGVAETGGQNAGEPAALGLPVVVGPHMENFNALMALLKKRDGVVQIPDAPALFPAFRRLLDDSSARQSMGRRASEALAIHQGATDRTIDLLA